MAKKQSQRINDLIFKELIKRGYSLEGNTRIWNIADSKLWYLTPEQAQGYLDLEKSEDYKKATGQPQGQDLIKNSIRDIIEIIGDSPINIIDLGCGDGIKASNFVKQLKELKPSIKIRYCPIDISGHMVETAIKTFSNLDIDEIIEFQYNISDFENLNNVIPLLRKGSYEKNIILLLGNTLGNFEIHELLYDIRSNMKGQDLFLIDTAINDDRQKERTKAYENDSKFDDWLIKIPLQLGLKKKDVKLKFRWENNRIEGIYVINTDKEITSQNKKIQFFKGDQMIVLVAYKYSIGDLTSFLNIHFDNVTVKVSEDKSKVLALCRK